MIYNNKIIFFLIIFFLNSCSLDNKTGIWSGSDKENEKLSEIERKQNKKIDSYKINKPEETFLKEVVLSKKIFLSKPQKNFMWKMTGLNHQNNIGNIYLPRVENNFLKKKVGKNKFSSYRFQRSIIAFKNHVIITDDKGYIFNVSDSGKIKWKKNIYTKSHKQLYKNLSISISKNIIYVADNIGFVYAINVGDGTLIWIKNYGTPFSSHIKIYNKKIFLIDQNNKIISLNIDDGSYVWNILSISSFIKSQTLLPLAISKKEALIVLNSAGDLFSIGESDGYINWATNVTGSLYSDASDFFESSVLVVSNEEIVFSNSKSVLSYNISNGTLNWETKGSSAGVPIIDGENIFFVTKNGFLVILNKNTGKVISSNNIFKILKEKKRKTQVTGFIMGSSKIYSTTLSGLVIVSSAKTGKVEFFTKIGDPILSAPIINNGKLYILTTNSKIVGFN